MNHSTLQDYVYKENSSGLLVGGYPLTKMVDDGMARFKDLVVPLGLFKAANVSKPLMGGSNLVAKESVGEYIGGDEFEHLYDMIAIGSGRGGKSKKSSNLTKKNIVFKKSSTKRNNP